MVMSHNSLVLHAEFKFSKLHLSQWEKEYSALTSSNAHRPVGVSSWNSYSGILYLQFMMKNVRTYGYF